MAHKAGLIWQGNFNIAVNNNALAAQARVDARVYSPVNKVFLFVRYLLDIVHPFVNINMAGTASANTAAIVLQLYAIFQANV
jgi:hypothetical protein